MLRHGSLFSGIGGFDLASTWMGWENIFSCEIDAFCRKILHYYWPKTKHHDDIYQLNATQYRGQIDIISGGFPCQPFSQSGRRKGKEDDRYLWPQALRIIREARPKWIVLENVAGLFTILEQENLSEMELKEIELFCTDDTQKTNSTIIQLQRRIIGHIVSDIQSAGYILPRPQDGTPIILCIPACAVDAPHRRDRIWFIAHTEHFADRKYNDRPTDFRSMGHDQKRWHVTAAPCKGWNPDHGCTGRTYSSYQGQEEEQGNCRPKTFEKHDGNTISCNNPQDDHTAREIDESPIKGSSDNGHGYRIPNWDEWPTQSPIYRRDDGISGGLDGIALSKWRTQSHKGYGNAIVPQVALQLFRAIETVDREMKNHSL
ncbi:DNA cytosine methyltransferase [Sphingobacterium sp. ML3W]|uniref:DNA cytosine methyltransferase n=1 Tax=Sphingobacterium sp. ML3W TaxID=1538644 RepID=UPI00249AA02A|nr:DNA cytosine methyltransferase [Sphingobacterium sp. ML3W]WFA81393.1 DNA cytosine methyltransferase [Sphingobacterium sp. ML3W]